MPKTAPKTAAATRPRRQNAIAMLTADHREVRRIFKEFEKLARKGADAGQKRALVEQACRALTVHAQLEEEIFYPAVRDAIEDDGLMDEATVEHATAKDLIAQLESASPDGELYDARFKVLGEYVDHHVAEEDGEMFPKVRQAGLDLLALGDEMAQRRAELERSPSGTRVRAAVGRAMTALR